jgi:Xaa-Pro aminopeptidase
MLMLRVRAVKTCYEIEMLRQSSTCTEKAIMDSLAVAANHATDIEIQSAFKKSLIDSGAEHLFSAIGVGTRSCFPNVVPEGTHLERGGLLRYDAGCRFQGFPSDLARNAVIGTAPERVRQIYQAMLNGEEAAIQFMRPGVLASEVFEVAMEATRKSGVSHYRRHHCGHAIGLDIYESPIIRPDDSTPLEAGMTFCIETPYYEVGLGGIQVEDLVVVTEDGSELLTALSRDLFEL